MKESTPKFTSTQWSTEADKLKFYRQFIRFMERGMPLQAFPKRFYECLIHCFGHIAHMDRKGFYEYWFGEAQRRCYFLRDTLTYCAVGHATHTYSDVEQAIQKWIGDHPEIVERYSNERDDLQKQHDLQLLRGLSEKYPQEAAAALGVGMGGGQ
jgi:hypothetical protein